LVKNNVEKFVELIKRFGDAVPQTIETAERLAEVMADKALAVSRVIENAINHDISNGSLINGNGNGNGNPVAPAAPALPAFILPLQGGLCCGGTLNPGRCPGL
jgi:VIT1/CCC1 family predicted Fe2+/Mn2+ transporter